MNFIVKIFLAFLHFQSHIPYYIVDITDIIIPCTFSRRHWKEKRKKSFKCYTKIIFFSSPQNSIFT